MRGRTLTLSKVFGGLTAAALCWISTPAYGASDSLTHVLLGDLPWDDFSFLQYGPVSAGYAFTPDTDIEVTHVRHVSGERISIWTDDGILLAAREVTDFSGIWLETPLLLPLKLQAAKTYRVTLWSSGYRYYWRNSSQTKFANGQIGPTYVANYDTFPTTVVGPRTYLVDLRYRAISADRMPAPANDLDLAIEESSDPIPHQDPIVYTVQLTNTGPAGATGVVVTNEFSGPVQITATSVSHGILSIQGSTVVHEIGDVAGNSITRATITCVPTNAGTIALRSRLSRAEKDAYYGNNEELITTTVLPRPAVFIFDTTVNEGNGGTNVVAVVLRLSHASSQAITVPVQLANGTARSVQDFVAVQDSVTFAPGSTNMTLPVAIIADAIDEALETFTIRLSAPTNAMLGRTQATVTILDDDPVPRITVGDVTGFEGQAGSSNWAFPVQLSSVGGRTVSVQYGTADGTALAGADYSARSGTLSFAPGVTNQFINVPVLGDLAGESNEVFRVHLTNASNAVLERSSASGLILNDDGLSITINNVVVPEGDQPFSAARFRVELSWPTNELVGVEFSTENGSALSAADYVATNGTVYFEPGSTAKEVVITIVGDRLCESNKVFSVQLTNAVNAALATPLGRCTITNDDPAPAINVNDTQVVEGDTGTTNVAFEVSLSEASGQTITVNFGTANNTAALPRDYVANSGTLVFEPGATNQTVTVSVLNDRKDETNETFFLTLSAPVNATLGKNPGVCTIISDEGLPGELHHFDWAGLPAMVLSGSSFPVQVSATDIAGDLVPGFTGPVSLLAQTNSPTAILFSESFEDFGTWLLEGWDPDYQYADVNIATNVAAQGNQSLYLRWRISRSLPNINPTQITFYLRTSTFQGFKGYFFAGQAGVGNALSFYMDNGGTMGLFNGGARAPYQLNVWHKIAFRLNWSTKRLDFLVDNNAIATNHPFELSTVTALTHFQLESFAPTWFDAFEMTGPGWVPAPGLVTPSSSGAFDAGVWNGAVSVAAGGQNVRLVATNLAGITGISAPLEVLAPNDLQIGMQTAQPLVYVNSSANFFISATNPGPALATQLRITNTFPAGTTFDVATPSQGSCSLQGNLLICALGDLGPGQQASINVSVRYSTVGNAVNRATLSSGSGADPNLVNNSAALTSTVLAGLHHFNFSFIQAPQQSMVPFPVVITAKDSENNTVSNWTGDVTLTASRLLREDFEDGNLDGWGVGPSWAQLVSVTNRIGGVVGSYAVNFLGLSGISHTLPDLRPTRVSFRVRMNSGGNAFCTISSGPDENQRVIHFQMWNGNFTLYTPAGNPSRPYVLNRWYTIAFVFNWATRTVSCSIDGVTFTGGAPFYGAASTWLRLIELYNGFDSDTWWDDVECVSTEAEYVVRAQPVALETFGDGVWRGEVSVDAAGTNVQLSVRDTTGHVGLGSTFDVIGGPAGVVDHFAWDPIPSVQTASVQFAATIRAKDYFGNTVSNFSGSARLAAVSSKPLEVLAFVRYSDVSRDLTGAVAAVSRFFTNMTLTLTTNEDPAQLERELKGKDIFLIPGQRYAQVGQMYAFGFAWSQMLTQFVTQGGSFIVLTAQAGEIEVFSSSGLLTLRSFGYGGGPQGVLNPVSGHFLTHGIVAPISFTNGLTFFEHVEGRDAVRFNGASVATTRDVGRGNVMFIGTRFDIPGSGADRVLANAFAWNETRRTIDVGLSPSNTTAFQNGVWSGSLVFERPVEHVRLLATDPADHYGLSAPFSVIVSNDLAVGLSVTNIVVVSNLFDCVLTVTNVGPSAATDVVLVHELAPNTVLASMTFPRGSCQLSGQTVTCHLGDLSPGSRIGVRLSIRPVAPGLITNRVTVSRGEPDFLAVNNFASMTTEVLHAPTFFVQSVSIAEGDGGATMAALNVRLFPPAAVPVWVAFETLSGSAQAQLDFIPTNGVLLFDPGVTNGVINVGILGDTISEFDETFSVRLVEASGALIGSDAMVTIVDGLDPTPIATVGLAEILEGDFGTQDLLFEARLSSPSEKPISLDYATENGTAMAPGDFTQSAGTLMFAAGVTSQLFSVTVRGDTANEPDEYLLLRLSNPVNARVGYTQASGVIRNDDAFPGKLDHFVVSDVPTSCFAGQAFSLSVSARDAFGFSLPGYNGPFDVSATRGVPATRVRILAFNRFVDERYATTLQVLSNTIGNFALVPTSNIDPALLRALLGDKDAFLIPAQSYAPGGFMAMIGTAWTAVLDEFVRSGGVVIVCSDNYNEHEVLLKSGLLELTRLATEVGEVVETTPSSRLMVGVPGAFTGTVMSTYATSNGIVHLRALVSSNSVVVSRSLGSGAAIMIGSGFFASGTPMDQVLANAMRWNTTGYTTPVPLNVKRNQQFIGGIWTSNVVILASASNCVLRASDEQGRTGQSAAFDVIVADFDGDGMPDHWEQLWGLDSLNANDANLDSDADGATNRDEFRAGTSPNDPSNSLRILALQIDEESLELSFSTVNGKKYLVEAAAALPGPWAVVSAGLIGKGVPLYSLISRPTNSRTAFLRVRLDE